MANRRELTPAEIECARRIRELWAKKQKTDQVSQPDAAHELGITQGGFSQFINAKVQIPPAMKVKIANYLGVAVTDIDPNFYEDLGLIDPELDDIEQKAVKSFRAFKGNEKAMLLGVLVKGAADLRRELLGPTNDGNKRANAKQ